MRSAMTVAVLVCLAGTMGLCVGTASDASGVEWRGLGPQDMQQIVGGTCIWEEFYGCTDQPSFPCEFGNCDPEFLTCDMTETHENLRDGYYYCKNALSGLTECDVPYTVYCQLHKPCDPFCAVNELGDISCRVDPMANGTPVSDHEEARASGSSCYGS